MAPKKQASLTDSVLRAHSSSTPKNKNAIRKKHSVLTNKQNEESALDREDLINTLRAFDLDINYGPCVGLRRKDRWQRAKYFNLNPPQNIIDMLANQQIENFLGEPVLQRCIWYNILE